MCKSQAVVDVPLMIIIKLEIFLVVSVFSKEISVVNVGIQAICFIFRLSV